MTKQRRHDCPDTVQHVIGRAVADEYLFPSDHYARIFWVELGRRSVEFEVEILALCLLGNHYHALVRGERDDISTVLHRALSRLANTRNRNDDRRGALVGRRFRSIPIADAEHFRNVIRYVPMNPVHHKLTRNPAAWRWSTHSIMLGHRPCPSWFNRDGALRAFGFPDADSYNRFVLAGTHLAPPPLTKTDFKRRNIRRLALSGMSSASIAELTGLSQRQVQRILKVSVAENAA